MEKVTVEGIIINETNYGETSKILNILTKEYGYISVMAKGSRTMKSKIRGISMKLVYANFTINYKPAGISTLIEGNLLSSFKQIMTDFSKMNYALYLAGLIKNVLKENNDKDLFFLLKNALLKINEDFNPSLITNIVEVKLLKHLGVKPNFEECVSCFSKEIFTFDLNLGGVVCQECYHDTYLFHPNTLKLLKLFLCVDLEKIDKLKISNQLVIKEINQFIKEYYETYTGIYLKNKDKFANFLNLEK